MQVDSTDDGNAGEMATSAENDDTIIGEDAGLHFDAATELASSRPGRKKLIFMAGLGVVALDEGRVRNGKIRGTREPLANVKTNRWEENDGRERVPRSAPTYSSIICAGLGRAHTVCLLFFSPCPDHLLASPCI